MFKRFQFDPFAGLAIIGSRCLVGNPVAGLKGPFLKPFFP